ncbi:MAG TPA: alpha/beta hydrolase-fold protein [Steroidobacteraceae bacterium]|nr:alpha/beta hydrolase-fold protein [Steroidobacteraceae bacterium]
MNSKKQLMLTLLLGSLAGISAAGQAPAAFVGPGPTSEALAALPQTPGAKGFQERHYRLEKAGREVGYHLYVPQKYHPSVGAPLVVALHGYGVNYGFFFSSVPDLPALCEQNGFICVAPMGYSTSGWYGAPITVPGTPPPGSRLPVPQTGTEKEQLLERELSELDVLNVIEIVTREYKVDPKRMYLMGHSMGGFGTWFLGQKHIDKWAAIAPMSGINDAGLKALDIRKLARIPVLVAVGEQEADTVVTSKKAVAALEAAGGKVTYVEIAGGTHGSMVAPSTARIMEFFSRH